MMNAQNNPTIVGIYSLGPSSPEGGSNLIVLENGKYAIIYFGGIQVGHWEFIDDKVCKFTPNIKEQEFELFGRHNKDLNDSTRISFMGFEENETFFSTGKKNENENIIMKRVFNPGANCFSYPYVHKFGAIENNILFMATAYNKKSSPVISFKNPVRYNDFVAFYFHKDENTSQPFFTTFKENKLFFNDGNYSQKSPLEENDEDIKFVIDFIHKDKEKDKVYFNPFYNFFEGDINETYIFNEEKGAFIDTKYYAEGVEYSNPEAEYDNMSIIYSFDKLKDSTIEMVKYQADENSLFYVICD